MGIGLKLLCLRREYFQKTEEDAPLSENKGDFTLHGHRHSCLYRETSIPKPWLTNRYLTSFFSKYSNPKLATGANL